MVRQEPSEFGKLLRQLRLLAGLSQDKLAERATLSTRAISDLERGIRRAPRHDTVELLITALELSPREQTHFRARARGEDSPSSRDPAAGEPAQPVSTLASRYDLPFIGRTRDLAIIHHHLTGPGPPCLLLSGEPGIGKTRLLTEAAARATALGYTVLSGGCLQLHAQEPYAPVTQAIADFIKAQTPVALRSLLTGCEWLTRVLPELEDEPVAPAPHGQLAPAYEHRLVLRAVRQVLSNAASAAGVVLILDDLQWLGADGSELLADILLHATDIRLQIIGSFRSTHETPPLAIASALVLYHQLEPLTDHDAADLVVAALGDGYEPAVRDAILRQAEGVPLFLVSLAASVLEGASASSLPDSVALSVRQRLSTLPESARSILTTAAVVGREVDPHVVQEATGSPLTTVLDTLDTACQLAFLVDGGNGSYCFVHDLIRDALEAEMSSARRRLVHQRVGAAIEHIWARFHAQSELPAKQLAFHYQQAGDAGRAIAYLRQAAMRSRRAAAHRDEASFLSEALALATKHGLTHLVADLRGQRGMAYFDCGAWAEARLDLEAAAPTPGEEAGALSARVLVSLALVCHWLFDVPSTRRYARQALQLAERLDDRDIAAEAISALAFADSSDGALAESLRQYHRAFAIAGARPNAHLVAAREMATLLHYWRGEHAQAIAYGYETLQYAREIGDTTSTARVLGNLGLALTGSGRYAEALEMFAEARRFCGDHSLPQWLARATSMAGSLHLALGDHATAEAFAEEALDLATSAAWPLGIVSAEIDLLLILARRGDTGARAGRLLQEATAAAVSARGAHGWLWHLRLSQVQAELALAREAFDETIRLATTSRRLARAHGRRKYEALGLVTCGAAMVRQHRDAEALPRFDDAISIARASQDPALLVYAAGPRLAIAPDSALWAEAQEADRRRTLAPGDTSRSRLAP